MSTTPRLTAPQIRALTWLTHTSGDEYRRTMPMPRIDVMDRLVAAGYAELPAGSFDRSWSASITDAGRQALAAVPAGDGSPAAPGARIVNPDLVRAAAPAAEDDVLQCGIFGHEMVGGACEACGVPAEVVEFAAATGMTLEEAAAVVAAAPAEPAAPTPTEADAALGTLTSEPGGFGAALGGLGFEQGRAGEDWSGGAYYTFDHPASLRVVVYTDDGDRLELIGFDPTRPAAKLLSWKASFDGTTPQSIVLAAIANALGVLPVTR